MGLRNGDAYRQSLRDGRIVLLDGRRVDDVPAHPAFRPVVDAVARMYDLQFDPQRSETLTFHLPSGERASRLAKLPRSAADWPLIRNAIATLIDHAGGMLERFGDEATSGLFMHYEIQDLLAEYDPRFAAAVDHWIGRIQRENLFLSSGSTDPKGDRTLEPHQQLDPDMYLRVVETREDGVVIRGAKFETGATYANAAFVKPSVPKWNEANRDYDIACIVPMGAPGVVHVCRSPMAPGADPFDRPLSALSDEIDTMIVFDNVFVPWTDVIHARTPALTARIRAVEMHRTCTYNYLVRALSKADIMVGTALMLIEHAKSTGIAQVDERLARLMLYRQTLSAHILAAEAQCSSGLTDLVMPDAAHIYAGRFFATLYHSEMLHLLREIAGGRMLLTPGAANMAGAESGPWVEKFFRTAASPAEARLAVLSLAADLTSSVHAGNKQMYTLFGESAATAQIATLTQAYDRDASLHRARLLLDRARDASRALPRRDGRLAAE